MIPERCGRWNHMPANVTGPMDPWMLLRTLGCRIGRNCDQYSGWLHFAVPRFWRVVIDERFLYIKNEHKDTRALLVDCDPPELTPVQRHGIRVEHGEYDGHHLLTGTAVTAVGQVVCRTYRIVRGDVVLETELVWHETAALLRFLVPSAHEEHFAYWDQPI